MNHTNSTKTSDGHIPEEKAGQQIGRYNPERLRRFERETKTLAAVKRYKF